MQLLPMLRFVGLITVLGLTSLALPDYAAAQQQAPCSQWYAEQALPKLGCSPRTIEMICTGALPRPRGTAPFCDGLEAPGYDTSRLGKTCQTSIGQCQMSQPLPLKDDCLCSSLPLGQVKGWVVKP